MSIIDEMAEAIDVSSRNARIAKEYLDWYRPEARAAARVVAKRLRERAEEYENRACMSEATMVERSLKAKATALREFADELDPPLRLTPAET